MMKPEMSRDRVNGFLDVCDRDTVNSAGEPIILTGWGLGNWLLPEGYMWLSNGASRFDRPRRIEAVIEELTGQDHARQFWQTFRDRYITEEDIRLMAKRGYNSVRIPINARLFLEEEPGLHWVDEGFERLDQCIDWCEAHRLYAFIDLHGAPGGQTGANIDDSLDDQARLFSDQDCFDKGVALWQKLAARYRDRWIVGGYDLLNEPLRNVRFAGDTDLSVYLPRLEAFYDAAIAAIRQVDPNHLISLEGDVWATGTEVFNKRYDPKMVIHFHRYGCLPDIGSYQPFLELSERWNSPLWLGETGENRLEWFAAMYPLATDLGIGYNVWPWKKMACDNSPLSIRVPDDWQRLIDYAKGGPHPGYESAQAILDQYLERIQTEQCDERVTVHAHVFRTPGVVLRATDFDQFPGVGESFSGSRTEENLYGYRHQTGMHIINRFPDAGNPRGFDSRWNRFTLELREQEFAQYTFHEVLDPTRLILTCFCRQDAMVQISQNGSVMETVTIKADPDQQKQIEVALNAAEKAVIRLRVATGVVEFNTLELQA